MKRSFSIKLTLVSGSLISLTACEPSAQNASQKIFSSKQDCSKYSDQKACDQAFKAAQKEHAKTAPRFLSLKECEDNFGVGKCAQQGTDQARSSSFFSPVMMGFMLGNLMSGAGARPIYMNKSNTMYSGSNPLNNNTQRGGFGSSSTSRSVAS